MRRHPHVRLSTDPDEGTTTLQAHHVPELASRAHQLGGRWDGQAHGWVFDARDHDRVQDLAVDLFGTDGQQVPADHVSLRVPVPDWARDEITAGRWRLAARTRSSEEVLLAPGVVVCSGGFPPTGGTSACPALNPWPGTVLEVRDLPPAVAEHLIATIPAAVVVADDVDHHDALLAERDRLRERLTAVEAQLGNHLRRDLSQAVASLRTSLDAGATAAAGEQPSAPSPTDVPAAVSGQLVRTWARTRGVPVSDRGRIAATTLRAYREAHPQP